MTVQVTASFPLVEFQAPAGTVVDHYVVTLSDGQVANPAAPADPTQPVTVAFQVAAGTYSYHVQAVDATGTPIGAPQTSNTVTVTDPSVITVLIPGAATLAQV